MQRKATKEAGNGKAHTHATTKEAASPVKGEATGFSHHHPCQPTATMVYLPCCTVERRSTGFQAVTPNLTQAQKGAKASCSPRRGGAAMFLTFVSSWDIGDIISAAQLVVSLIGLFLAIRKKKK